jgi:nucleotide-binding universal stress UspA family protein
MRILLCISNFPYATSTVEFGKLIINALQSKATVMSVRSASESPHVGESILNNACKLLDLNSVSKLIRYGTPAKQILEEIKKGDYDLVIMGAHDQPSFGELFLGSVSRRIVDQSPISVLIVRQPSSNLDKILVPIAGRKASNPTVQMSARLAKAFKAKVTLLHVASTIPSMYSGMDRLDENLSELLQTDSRIARNIREFAAMLRSIGIDAHIELRHGTPIDEIFCALEKENYALMVIGSSRHSRFNRLFTDEIALQLVDHAFCPVLVMKELTPISPQDKAG